MVVNTQIIITPLCVNNVIACSSPVLIKVANTVAGTMYRVYNNQSDLNYIQQDTLGIFNIKVESSQNFYVTQVDNNCESNRILVKVKLGSSQGYCF